MIVNSTKIPVVVITGFLGSGKTTLLNYLVKQPDLRRTAVIINEFGEIGIDHLLVETSAEQMIEINNGCICCTVRGDLQDKLGSLAMWLDVGRIPPVDRVIVETTGLADPAPIMHTLMTDRHLLNRFRLSNVITVIDPIAGSSSLYRFPEAVKQIAIADDLVVSKMDLVETLPDRGSYVEFRNQVGRLNARAVIHEAAGGKVDTALLIRDVIDEGESVLAELGEWLNSADETASAPGGHEVHSHDTHRSDIRTFCIELRDPVDKDRFNEFLQELASDFGENLLRVKGLLNVKGYPERPAVVHGVQHVFFPILWLDQWPGEERTSKFVFITQGILPQSVQARFAQRSLH